MSIVFNKSNELQLNNELQQRANRLIEEGKNPINELAKKILFVEQDHAIRIIENAHDGQKTDPRIAKIIQDVILQSQDSSTSLLRRVLQSQLAEELTVANRADLTLIPQEHPFVTLLDLTQYENISPEQVQRLVLALPNLAEIRLPPNCETFFMPQNASTRQLEAIPRLYPHLKKLNTTYWSSFDETALNAIIPQLHEVTHVHMSLKQIAAARTIIVPHKASSEYFGNFPPDDEGKFYYPHWQHANAFWYFIEKIHNADTPDYMKRTWAQYIVTLLSISEDISQHREGFTIGHRFELYMCLYHEPSNFHQAIAALQALHPELPIDQSPPIPLAAHNRLPLKAFFHMHPGSDLHKLVAERSHMRCSTEEAFPSTRLRDLERFSSHCEGKERFSPAQLLGLQIDFTEDELACLKFLHPDLFAKYPGNPWKHASLEEFFLVHSAASPRAILKEYLEWTETSSPEIESLENIAKFSETNDIPRLEPTHYLQLHHGFGDDEIRILQILHPRVREQLKKCQHMTFPECLERIFQEYPQITLTQILAACPTDEHDPKLRQLLENCIALEHAIKANDVEKAITAFNGNGLASIASIAKLCGWPKNRAWNYIGLCCLTHNRFALRQYLTDFCDAAGDVARLKYALDTLQAAPCIANTIDESFITNTRKKLQALIPLEAIMRAHDSAAATALKFSAVNHEIIEYFSISDLLDTNGNDEIRLIITAKMLLLEVVSLEKCLFYSHNLSIEKLCTKLREMDPRGIQRLLLKMEDAQVFTTLLKEFPEQRAAIQKMKEEWHRVHVTRIELLDSTGDHVLQDYPQWEAEDVMMYGDRHGGVVVRGDILRFREAIQSHNMQNFIDRAFKEPSELALFLVPLFLPLADPREDAILRLAHIIDEVEADDLDLYPHDRWLRLLSMPQYVQIYEELKARLPAGNQEDLQLIDTAVRKIVGAEEPPLHVPMFLLQGTLHAFFFDVNRALNDQLSKVVPATTLPERLRQITDAKNYLIVTLTKAVHAVLPRRSPVENYMLELLHVFFKHRIFEATLDMRLQLIEESPNYDGYTSRLSQKFDFLREFYGDCHDAVYQARNYCRLLTPQQHAIAFADAETRVPPAQKGLLRQIDTMVRFEIDPAHMARGDTRLDIPPAPAGVAIAQLRELLRSVLATPAGLRLVRDAPAVDSRVFESTDLAEMQAIMTSALPNKSDEIMRAQTVEAARQIFISCTIVEKVKIGIEVLISRIVHKTKYFAVPDGAALTSYYEEITRALSHTILALQHADAATQASFFSRLLNGIGHCGIRMKYDIIQAYKEYALHAPQTPTSCIDGPLGELRTAIAQNVPGGQSAAESILPAMHFMRKYGAIYGIPGAAELAVDGAPEFLANAAFDPARAVHLFRGGYNSGAVYEWVKDLNTEEFKNYVLEFYNRVPNDWQPQSNIREEIATTVAAAKKAITEATSDRAIMAQLQQLGIRVPPPETRTQAYRDAARAAIRAQSTGTAAAPQFQKTAHDALQAQIEQDATDSQLFATLSALRVSNRDRFIPPTPPSQPITATYRTTLLHAIDTYATDALHDAYLQAEVLDATGGIRPEAILTLLTRIGVLRNVVQCSYPKRYT